MQHLLPGKINTLFANDGGAPVITQAPILLEPFFVLGANPNNITNHIRCRCPLRIFAHPTGLQIYPRETVSLGRKPRSLNLIDIISEQQGAIAARLPGCGQKTFFVTSTDIDHLTELIKQSLQIASRISWGDGQDIVTIVAGQDLTIAVKNLAAPWRQRQNRNTILVRLGSQSLITHHL